MYVIIIMIVLYPSFCSFFQEFRRSQEPEDRSKLGESYYNLLAEYNSTLLRKTLPGVFEKIDVRETESRYPGLRITYNYSTIFLAPQSHCDPIKYMYNDSLAAKTLDAHLWINGYQEDLGCETGLQKFDKGVRCDSVLFRGGGGGMGWRGEGGDKDNGLSVKLFECLWEVHVHGA